MDDRPLFTFNYEGQFPDKVKVKKNLALWPLEFSATLIWDFRKPRDEALSHTLCCKDQVLRGKISIRPNERSIEYRKRFRTPWMLQGIPSNVVACACWQLEENSFAFTSWKPRLHLGFELRQDLEYKPLGSVAGRFKLPVHKHLGLEVRGRAQLALPSSLQFDLNGEDRMSQEGAALDLTAQELNLLVRL